MKTNNLDGITPEMKTKLKYWNTLQGQIKDAQAEEKGIRKEIVDALFASSHEDGSHRVCVGDLEIVTKRDTRVSIAKGALDEATPEELAWLNDNLLKQSVSINKAAYRALPDNVKLNLGKFVQESPALPTLDIKNYDD